MNDTSRPEASRLIDQHQKRLQKEEVAAAARALLMHPLMTTAHEDLVLVRRHADALRVWFSRETGWRLQIEAEVARLFKRPANLSDATRGLEGYDRRRYILLCLACAVLERADSQITLQVLGDRILAMAGETTLSARDFSFTLTSQHERRELVAVCKTLLGLGALQRVAGEEDNYSDSPGAEHDALYDVNRRVLSGLLAAARGPSSWPAETAPISIDDRLHSLVDEHVPDSAEGRRTAFRHRLTRRLLDDPVIYVDSLEPDEQAYFLNQRGVIAARITEMTSLTAEQRAEGLAMVDADGTLTDIAIPAEGTEAHATLLVAEFLAERSAASRIGRTARAIPEQDVVEFLREAKQQFGKYWRKSAREANAERELAVTAIDRLCKLQLLERSPLGINAMPALWRFSLGETVVRTASDASDTAKDLFAAP